MQKIVGNYLVRENEAMTVAFGTRGKRRLNRVMNVLGFEYLDYSNPTSTTETGDMRKRGEKLISKRASKREKQKEVDGSEEPKTRGSDSDEDSLSNRATPLKRKKDKITKAIVEKTITKEQGKVSASTLSLGCTQILEVMTQPLPFFTLGPLGSDVTSLLLIAKGVGGEEKEGDASMSAMVEESPVREKSP
jgi:hypothetical protein